jgi:predicted RNase H-like HicB family nuclease
LPGCISEGETLAKIRETAEGWLESGNDQEPESDLGGTPKTAELTL